MMMTDTAPALLEIDALRKRFVADGPWVVNEVSLTLRPGEVLALVGPSGCGKTTLLRLVAGFERPDAGRITLGGQTLCEHSGKAAAFLPPEKRGVGIVFQDYALFPHRSVLGNVMFGMTGPRQARRDQAMALLAMLDMDQLAHRRPQTLSGGQQQRVALARTLAAKPRLVLLDEPFSNLDVTLRESARREVRQALAAQDVAAILVTHDREEALAMGDRVAVMHQGRLLQVDPPAVIYHQPRHAFVAGFLGGMIPLTGQAAGHTVRTPLGTLPLPEAAHGELALALRSDQVRLVPWQPGEAVAGVIEHREFRGHGQTVILHVNGMRCALTLDAQAQAQPGDRVGVRLAGQPLVFDAPDA